jgi:transcriptional regulator with XRE-family HTH domain
MRRLSIGHLKCSNERVRRRIEGHGPDRGFGTFVRQHRVAAHLSQEQLAERSGMSVSAIASLERGRRTAPQRQTVDLLVSALRLEGEGRVEFELAASQARFRRAAQREGSIVPIGTRLPEYLTSFVGRDAEVAELARLLRDHRLLTVVGAGGTGKTRLACAIATMIGTEFGKIRFLDLRELRGRITSSCRSPPRSRFRQAGRMKLSDVSHPIFRVNRCCSSSIIASMSSTK